MSTWNSAPYKCYNKNNNNYNNCEAVYNYEMVVIEECHHQWTLKINEITSYINLKGLYII